MNRKLDALDRQRALAGLATWSLDRAVSPGDHRRLEALGHPELIRRVTRLAGLCRPERLVVVSDALDDIDYVRRRAVDLGEEAPLATPGHTVHFDGPRDQARDKANTRVLVPPGMRLGPHIRTLDRDAGLKEMVGLLDGIMEGKEAFLRFFALGPTSGRFTRLAVQVTDSAYVAHSEDLLYRQGYRAFQEAPEDAPFYLFVHSAGPLDHRGTSRDVDRRRVYVDLVDSAVYSVNNQYAGNSLGLKKLALRLAIYEANHSDWLTEHMFVMGVHPRDRDRVTYFTGAFPSACGKTSTAMIPGQSIVGDDIAYLRADGEGRCRAVNIEQGVFGIIRDVNPEDDPLIHRVLTTPREMIFSNVLVSGGRAWWTGMGEDLPGEGENHVGHWRRGQVDDQGRPVPASHPNARYTIRIEDLDNADPALHDPEGVVIHGVLYGGRDADTNVPIRESLSWAHGVFMGATIESQTTAATLDAQGVRKASPMAIMDFMVVPLGRYLRNHLDFGSRLRTPPRVFTTNYFLEHEGQYLNRKTDKKAWLLWAEARVHGEVGALATPVGFLPRYEDLARLFRDELGRGYAREDYELQFAVRVDRLLEKLARIREWFAGEQDLPSALWDQLLERRESLRVLRARAGTGVVPPSWFERESVARHPAGG